MAWLDEPVTVLKLVSVVLVLAGVIGLQLSGGSPLDRPDTRALVLMGARARSIVALVRHGWDGRSGADEA